MFQKNQAKMLIFAPYIGFESRVFWYGHLSLFGADFSKACLRKDDLWELAEPVFVDLLRRPGIDS